MDQNQNYQSEVQTEKVNDRARVYAIVALVSGILAILTVTVLCCFYYITPVFGTVAIVFSILSAKKGFRMRGMALAGLILAIVALLLFTLLLLGEIILNTAFSGLTDAEIEAMIYEYFGINPEEFESGLPAGTLQP